MSAATVPNVNTSAQSRPNNLGISEASAGKKQSKESSNGDYRGFVAGIASGVTKLTGMSERKRLSMKL